MADEQNDQQDFRTIESVGREGLLREITDFDAYVHEDVLTGIGDDAAVISETEQRASLLSSESLLEGVNFDLTYTPLHHLGYKGITMTVSDIYAMNARPTAMLVNIALPNKLSVDMVKKIYEGIYKAGNDYQAQLVGGDMTASHNILTLNFTVYGRAEKSKIRYRRGAQIDDVICVTGDLGAAIAGLRVLMREKQEWKEKGEEDYTIQPDFTEYKYVVERQLLPAARSDFVDILNEHDIHINGLIDVTQGLLHDVYQLARASETGFYLYQSTIPIALETRKVADEMKEDVDKYALYGGEDMEMLFTLPQDEVEELSQYFEDFSVIGEITPRSQGMKMQTPEGEAVLFEEEEEA